MKRWNGKRHCYECFGFDAPICEECFKPDPTFKGISARDSLLARVNATAKTYPLVEKELLKIENDARNGLLIKIQRGVTRMSIEATHRINRRYPMFAELHRFGVFDEPEAVRAIKIHMQAMQKNLVSYMENLSRTFIPSDSIFKRSTFERSIFERSIFECHIYKF